MYFRKNIFTIVFLIAANTATCVTAGLIDHSWLLEFGEDRIMDLSSDCSTVPDLEVGTLGIGVLGVAVTSDLCHNVNTLTEANYQCNLFLDYPAYVFCSKDESEVQLFNMISEEISNIDSIAHVKSSSISFNCESIDRCHLEPDEIRTMLLTPTTTIIRLSDVAFDEDYFYIYGATKTLESIYVEGWVGNNNWEFSVDNIYTTELFGELVNAGNDLNLNLICTLMIGGTYHEGTATAILGTRVDSDICANVKSLETRGYECLFKINYSPLATGDVFFSDTNCYAEDSEINIFASQQFFTPLDYKEPSQELIVSYWNENIEDYLHQQPDLIAFNCHSLNACANTGEEVARYLVNNIDTISSMEKNIVENNYSGITNLAETVTIFPADGFFYRLWLNRGKLDGQNENGITIK